MGKWGVGGGGPGAAGCERGAQSGWGSGAAPAGNLGGVSAAAECVKCLFSWANSAFTCYHVVRSRPHTQVHPHWHALTASGPVVLLMRCSSLASY